MRLALHTVVCCCVFTAVLPLARGAPGEYGSGLRKRFKAWLLGRVKRDVRNSSPTAVEKGPEPHIGPLAVQSRSARSAGTLPKKGCYLVTCTVHDLIFWVHQVTDKSKDATAPPEKMGSKGYGRRRRRSAWEPRARPDPRSRGGRPGPGGRGGPAAPALA